MKLPSLLVQAPFGLWSHQNVHETFFAQHCSASGLFAVFSSQSSWSAWVTSISKGHYLALTPGWFFSVSSFNSRQSEVFRNSTQLVELCQARFFHDSLYKSTLGNIECGIPSQALRRMQICGSSSRERKDGYLLLTWILWGLLPTSLFFFCLSHLTLDYFCLTHTFRRAEGKDILSKPTCTPKRGADTQSTIAKEKEQLKCCVLLSHNHEHTQQTQDLKQLWLQESGTSWAWEHVISYTQGCLDILKFN